MTNLKALKKEETYAQLIYNVGRLNEFIHARNYETIKTSVDEARFLNARISILLDDLERAEVR